MEIDFVITWVDMNDPKWKKNFAKYAGKIDNGPYLQEWIDWHEKMGVEKFYI